MLSVKLLNYKEDWIVLEVSMDLKQLLQTCKKYNINILIDYILAVSVSTI